MATTYLPFIRPEDFETFKRMLGPNLPDAYDDWRNLVLDRSLQIAKTPGLDCVTKEVDPDKFAAWLATHGHKPTANALDNFAFFVAAQDDRE